MRYKIEFAFPYFDQKNIQHAHSHFAFGGWVSLTLMVLMVNSVRDKLDVNHLKLFHSIFLGNLLIAYGMLISFFIQGYGIFSITFSSLSILFSFWFCIHFYKVTNRITLHGKMWYNAALLFNIISAFGTFSLSYMMASKQIEQHTYLASIYWYLHFQYNGWFFFACAGLFFNYLSSHNILFKKENVIFYLFVLSCIPAYGLSVLWMQLHMSIYVIIVGAAIAQFAGLFLFIKEIKSHQLFARINIDFIGRLLMLAALLAFSVKICLQLGSVVPAVSKFAFGFRPIVIAYLHLVLLAFITVFLIGYTYAQNLIASNASTKYGIVIFVAGIFLNEFILGIQGIASISYVVVPYGNMLLFGVAMCMFLGLLLLNISALTQKKLL
jgi:hypothetical protein